MFFPLIYEVKGENINIFFLLLGAVLLFDSGLHAHNAYLALVLIMKTKIRNQITNCNTYFSTFMCMQYMDKNNKKVYLVRYPCN